MSGRHRALRDTERGQFFLSGSRVEVETNFGDDGNYKLRFPLSPIILWLVGGLSRANAYEPSVAAGMEEQEKDRLASRGPDKAQEQALGIGPIARPDAQREVWQR